MQDDLNQSEWALLLEGVLFYGDPHGRWDPLLKALGPETKEVIILGDLADAAKDPAQVDTARRALQDVRARGIKWWTISGNHDTETDEICDLLHDEMPGNLLDGKVVQATGMGTAIAGLGGVVRGRVWDGRGPAQVHSPEDMIAASHPSALHRGGLPRRHRSTIFPSEVAKLGLQRADVLVSHEAPSCNRHGFSFIDRLAGDMGAGLIVHGHHHLSYESVLPNGVRVKGLGRAEVWQPSVELSPTQRSLLRAGVDTLRRGSATYDLLKDL